MPPRERLVDRGTRRARQARQEMGRELREARLAAGLTQKALGHAVAISRSEVGRIEAALRTTVSVERLAQLFAVVGMELSVRAYPAGSPLRDAGHLALLNRFRARCSSLWRWATEVPVDLPGDLRAWDAKLVLGDVRIGVEAETRIRDVQALQRRIEGKRRDSGIDRVILVVADTRTNRAALRAAGDVLAGSYPVPAPDALAALAAGRDPGGDAIILM
jgi:transcriptional regulator with XRE-family HTH domain